MWILVTSKDLWIHHTSFSVSFFLTSDLLYISYLWNSLKYYGIEERKLKWILSGVAAIEWLGPWTMKIYLSINYLLATVRSAVTVGSPKGLLQRQLYLPSSYRWTSRSTRVPFRNRVVVLSKGEKKHAQFWLLFGWQRYLTNVEKNSIMEVQSNNTCSTLQVNLCLAHYPLFLDGFYIFNIHYCTLSVLTTPW